MIRVFTKDKRNVIQNIKQTTLSEQDMDEKSEVSSGELKLYNVEERTAAMIMAIVSDESGIPLSELYFKSIKAIENDMDDSKEATV